VPSAVVVSAADEQEVHDHVRRLQRRGERERDHNRHEPGHGRKPRRRAPHPVELELEAGEEEEEREPELGQELGERRHVDEREHGRADEDAEQDLDHDEWRRRPRGEVGRDRCDRSKADDDHERREVDLHPRDPLTREKRGRSPDTDPPRKCQARRSGSDPEVLRPPAPVRRRSRASSPRSS
jgi:hypothetical protein